MSTTWTDGMSTPDLDVFREEIQEGLDVYHEAFRKAQAVYQTLLLHDHPFGAADPQRVLDLIEGKVDEESSELFAPQSTDLLLKEGTIPILTIRDPRIAVTSAFRVLGDLGLPHGSGRPNFQVSTSTLWIRWLCDLFTAHNITPIVVFNADDIMTANSDFVVRSGARPGLDREAMLTNWDPPYDHVSNEGHLGHEEYEGLHPMYYKCQRVLIESSGPDEERAAKNVDLKKEEAAWENEFGMEDAELVREAVESARPHYEWLREAGLR